MKAIAHGELGWRHAFGGTIASNSQRFSVGDAFTVTGVPVAKDVALFEAGINFNITSNAVVGTSYIGLVGSAQVKIPRISA